MTTVDNAPTAAPAVTLPAQRQPPTASPAVGPDRIPAVLTELRARLDASRPTNVGFPSTLDLVVTPLMPFFNDVLNKVGDPDLASVFPAHTRHLEREVVDIIAGLLRAPEDDRWGYVTSGGSEGVEYGALLGRTLHPDAVIDFSRSAHHAIAKIATKLRIPAVTIRSRPDGRLDLLRDLRVALRQNRHLGAIVVANIGTSDDIPGECYGLLRDGAALHLHRAARRDLAKLHALRRRSVTATGRRDRPRDLPRPVQRHARTDRGMGAAAHPAHHRCQPTTATRPIPRTLSREPM